MPYTYNKPWSKSALSGQNARGNLAASSAGIRPPTKCLTIEERIAGLEREVADLQDQVLELEEQLEAMEGGMQ